MTQVYRYTEFKDSPPSNWICNRKDNGQYIICKNVHNGTYSYSCIECNRFFI